jgi:hypothetical protein
MTKTEAATLLVAHLDTLVRRACGNTVHSEATEADDIVAMKRVVVPIETADFGFEHLAELARNFARHLFDDAPASQN